MKNVKLDGKLLKLEVEVQEEVAECIKIMEAHSKISASSLVNTALKRFISAHKDYLPDGYDFGKPHKKTG